MKWLALDIGGANLKVANGRGYAATHGFAMWRNAERLARELRTLIAEAPASDHLAVTMTGELADCFESRAQGVQFILDSLGDAADRRHTRVYLNDGRLVTPQVALRQPAGAASSNWHALARFAGRFAPSGPALLLDVGSTTCDLTPLVDGQAAHNGVTDTERLIKGELVYTGVERSPVCSLVDALPYRGWHCPVARELFATSRDVYLLRGDLAEQPTDTATADGRPATKRAARVRMGRMVCAMDEEFNHRDAVVMSEAVAEVQAQQLADAIRTVVGCMGAAGPQRVILSGHGDFLARRAMQLAELDVEEMSLTRKLGAAIARAAPAHALAVLADEALAP